MLAIELCDTCGHDLALHLHTGFDVAPGASARCLRVFERVGRVRMLYLCSAPGSFDLRWMRVGKADQMVAAGVVPDSVFATGHEIKTDAWPAGGVLEIEIENVSAKPAAFRMLICTDEIGNDGKMVAVPNAADAARASVFVARRKLVH